METNKQTNSMKNIPWMAFSIDRTSPVPVFEQICRWFRAETASGELPAGTKLPPTRVFATELGVSRSTVVTAYEQLVAEGYLTSRRGSGYRVCEMGPVELPARRAPPVRTTPTDGTPSARPFQISQPDMRLFPYSQWAKTVSRICRTAPARLLVGDGGQGNMELRRAVAAHVSEWRGIDAGPHQVMITAGADDALEMCLRTLLRRGDEIGLEDPGYLPLRDHASALGLKAVFMEIDGGGAVLTPSAGKARLIALTPSHQFPLGGAMSASRRLEFIHWAEENNRWIVEDDYDSEFRYAGRPIPAMAGFNALRRTIYVGSFSKIFSNSLRLGYLIAPDALVERFQATQKRFGVKASAMPQEALAQFIGNGEFYRHLRRMRRIYAERRKYLLDRLTGSFRSYGSFEDHQAGMQIAFHLNPGLPDTEIAQRAAHEGVTIQPLSQFSHGKSSLNGLLFGFCAFTPEEMDEALTILAGVLEPD